MKKYEPGEAYKRWLLKGLPPPKEDEQVQTVLWVILVCGVILFICLWYADEIDALLMK